MCTKRLNKIRSIRSQEKWQKNETCSLSLAASKCRCRSIEMTRVGSSTTRDLFHVKISFNSHDVRRHYWHYKRDDILLWFYLSMKSSLFCLLLICNVSMWSVAHQTIRLRWKDFRNGTDCQQAVFSMELRSVKWIDLVVVIATFSS